MDAFTDRPFAGNPAGVCLLDAAADPAWMQRVATEMRHSETAFVRRDGAEWELRWFTPVLEVALCGHATLASAHTLYETGLAAPDAPIRFRTLHSGVLTVRRDADGVLEMDFPSVPAQEAPAPDGLADVFGVTPLWTGRNAQDDWLVRVSDAATVRALDPDAEAVARLDARGVILTAPADGDHDFVSRFFGARSLDGAEDPVTGSAHCALAPYWAERLGRTALTGYQASARGGSVGVRVEGDRVVLRGRAVTVLAGDLRV